MRKFKRLLKMTEQIVVTVTQQKTVQWKKPREGGVVKD